MKPKLDKGGIVTNLDQTLTKEQVAESRKLDHAEQVLDDAKASARSHGGDHFATYSAAEAAPKDGYSVTNALLEKSAREIGTEHCIKPISSIEGDPRSPFGRTWVLTDDQLKAIDEWRFCPCCLFAQKTTTNSQCEWAIEQHGVKGCSYNRIAEQFFRE